MLSIYTRTEYLLTWHHLSGFDLQTHKFKLLGATSPLPSFPGQAGCYFVDQTNTKSFSCRQSSLSTWHQLCCHPGLSWSFTELTLVFCSAGLTRQHGKSYTHAWGKAPQLLSGSMYLESHVPKHAPQSSPTDFRGDSLDMIYPSEDDFCLLLPPKCGCKAVFKSGLWHFTA